MTLIGEVIVVEDEMESGLVEGGEITVDSITGIVVDEVETGSFVVVGIVIETTGGGAGSD